METKVPISDLVDIINRSIEREADKDLAMARKSELNNILSFALLEPEGPDDRDAIDLVESGRKRLIELIADPKSAGNHNHTLEKQWAGRKDWDDEDKPHKLYYSDEK